MEGIERRKKENKRKRKTKTKTELEKEMEGRERERELKIGFWNVAVLSGKNEDFWKRFEEWDVVGIVETWIEQKDWEKIKRKMPRGYIWKIQSAKKEGKRRRASGGIIMGVKKGLEEKEEWTDKDGMLVKKVQWKGEKWGIGTVYCRGNSKEILERVSKIVGMEGKREG